MSRLEDFTSNRKPQNILLPMTNLIQIIWDTCKKSESQYNSCKFRKNLDDHLHISYIHFKFFSFFLLFTVLTLCIIHMLSKLCNIKQCAVYYLAMCLFILFFKYTITATFYSSCKSRQFNFVKLFEVWVRLTTWSKKMLGFQKAEHRRT